MTGHHTLRVLAETHVYVRFSHSALVAMCVSREERTCTCVPAGVWGANNRLSDWT